MAHETIGGSRNELVEFKEQVWSAIAHLRGEIRDEVSRQVLPVSKAIAAVESEVWTQQEHLFQHTLAGGKTIGSFADAVEDYVNEGKSNSIGRKCSNGHGEHSANKGISVADVRVLNALVHKMEAVDAESKRYGKVLSKLREGVKLLGTDVASALQSKANQSDVLSMVKTDRDKVNRLDEEWRLALGDINSSYRRDFAKIQAESATSAHRVTEIYTDVKQIQEKDLRELVGRVVRLEHQMDEITTLTRSAAEESRQFSRQLSEEIRAYSRLSLAAPGAIPALLGVGGGNGGSTSANGSKSGNNESASSSGSHISRGGDGGVGIGVGESLVTGRWLWTSGRLAIEPLDTSYALQYALSNRREGSTSSSSSSSGSSGWIWWDQQAANAAPPLLLWQPPGNGRSSGGIEAMSITAVLPGLYRLCVSIFAPPEQPLILQVYLNGEALFTLQQHQQHYSLSSSSSSSSLNNDSATHCVLRRHRHPAGHVTSVGIDEFVSLPAHAVLTVHYGQGLGTTAQRQGLGPTAHRPGVGKGLGQGVGSGLSMLQSSVICDVQGFLSLSKL